MLITRAREDAARTAAKLTQLGHEAMIDSVIEIEPLPLRPVSGTISALAFTSANGARYAEDYDEIKSIPAFAVGEHTAEAAREAGFTVRAVAEGDVDALGRLIAGKLAPQQTVLHLAGEDRAGDLSAHLAQQGIKVETRIIYRARASTSLRKQTVDAFVAERVDAVLHYSQRSAAIFLKLADAARLQARIGSVHHYCISQAAASPLSACGVEVKVSRQPSEAALLNLLPSPNKP